MSVTSLNSSSQPAHTVAAIVQRLRDWLESDHLHGNAQEYPRLVEAEVFALLNANTSEEKNILDLATELRDFGLKRAHRPGIITYSKKAFLPITNLCRDRCHYCTFVETPKQLEHQNKSLFMPPERILAIARQAAALGCKEALFTLGDRPEERWPQARAWLDERGFSSTLNYVKAMATLVREETGLLPHLNPGVMTAQELSDLRPHAPSMGMMLETTSSRLWSTPGKAHFGSPDKDPSLRLEVLENAGVLKIPFTTGILVGIGETLYDRAESILALYDIHLRHGHLQEIIVQNFRAKTGTAMRSANDLTMTEFTSTIAATRLVFGPDMRIQAPPNLAHQQELELLLRAGIDDWGGVSPLTADHVNPERPWPSLEQLSQRTSLAGFELRERLTTYPKYLRERDIWVDSILHEALSALTDEKTFLADERAPLQGVRPTPDPIHIGLRGVLSRAAESPDSLSDDDLSQLLFSEGSDLENLCQLADDLRRYTVGETVSYVANRSIDLYACSESNELANVAHETVALGLSELCVQGLHGLPSSSSRPSPDLVRIAQTLSSAEPGLHLHAFRPNEIAAYCERTDHQLVDVLQMLKSAGVKTLPGTGVRLLGDDKVSSDWTKTIRTAHLEGMRTTSVISYGYGESPRERISHLRKLTMIHAETFGFTECVLMPAPSATFTPILSRRSRLSEHRAMAAVTRLLLNANISQVQAAWTRLSFEELVATLRSGANDIGGTLHKGRVLANASAEGDRYLSSDGLEKLSMQLMRSLRQRNTTYEELGPEQTLEAAI